MARRYFLISMTENFEPKFNNMIKNLNALNNESEGIKIEGQYGEKPEYVAIPKMEKR